MLADLASTRMMWASGAIAETMSRSSDSSPAQPLLFFGSVLVPVWLTCWKQPPAAVHAGSPYWLR